MTDGVEVKLGANAGPLKSETAGAADSVAESLKKISQVLVALQNQSGATEREVRKHTTGIAHEFSTMKDKVGSSLSAVSTGIEKVKNTIALVGALVAGGALWKEVISSTIHLQSEVDTLERIMGMTSKEATAFAVQLKVAGSSADTFTTTALHMGRQLKTQEDEFHRLGVKIKDVNGNLLPMQQIMRNTYERMQEFKGGTDQNMVALTLAGRSAKDFGEQMENLERVEQRAHELQQQLNIEMGPERQAQVKAYKDEINALGVVWDNIAARIGEKVMPRLQGVAGWVNEHGPAIANVFLTTAKVILSALEIVGKALGAYLTLWTTIFKTFAESFASGVEVIGAVLRGRLSDIPAILARGMRAAVSAAKDGVSDIGKQYDLLSESMSRLWSSKAIPGSATTGGPKSGPNTFTPAPQKGAGDESVMSALDAQLKAQQDAYERMKLEQGSFERWSLQQTSDYWRQVLDTVKLSTKDREAVLSKFYDAERAIRLRDFSAELAALDEQKSQFKNNYDARVRIAQLAAEKIRAAFGAGSPEAINADKNVTEQENAKVERDRRVAEIESSIAERKATHGIAMERLASDQQLALRQITAEQSLQLEAGHEERLFAIKKAALEKRKALQDQHDLVALAEIQSQIEAATMEHEERLTAIHNQAVRERSKDAIAGADAIKSSFADALTSIADGTKSVGSAFKDMGKSIAHSLNQIASKNIAEMLLGGSSGGGNIIATLMQGLFGGGAGGAPGGGGFGMNDRGAGAAPGSGIFSMLASLFTGVPALADGTNYVPRDTLAFLHKGEGVTPARYNNNNSRTDNRRYTSNYYPQADTRSRSQAQLSMARATQRAAYRDG